MSFDHLPPELVCEVLRAYGTSPEAFCLRWASRRVCKLFYLYVPLIAEKIIFADWILQNIHAYLQKHSPCKAYDIDDSMFVRIPGEQPGRGLLSKVEGIRGTRILYHPFSEKFVISRFNTFWRSSSLESLRNMPKHVKEPFGMTSEKTSICRSKLCRSKSDKVFEHKNVVDAMTIMIKSLLNSHHASVTKISCKETSLTEDGFTALAVLLHKNANIARLNISCHMNDGSSDLILPVLHVASIVHLNISFCGSLSTNEGCALIRLMKKKKLTTLKTIGTEIPWFEYFLAALALSSVVDLTYTLPRYCCITASYIYHICNFNSLQVYDDVNLWTTDEFSLIRLFGKDWAHSSGSRSLTDFDRDYFETFSYETMQDCIFLVDTFMKLMKMQDDKPEHTNVKDEGGEVPKVVLKLKQPELKAFKTEQSPSTILRDRRQEIYDKRNRRRNELISTPKTCKSCMTVWPEKSIKLQAFEGLQSMCYLGKRSCHLSMHYKTVFGESGWGMVI